MHRLTSAAALVVALVLALPASAASADVRGATIDKTGWWNRANAPTATPAGPVAVPPPPGVPEGDLAVGRLGTETTAVAAVGIQPDEAPGATVESATLVLREDPAAQANRGGEGATVLACPIVSFWAGGENSAWDTRPEEDCGAASVIGERADDGTWTFDLTPIATLWFDSFGAIRADGVSLLPDPDAESSSFQVVWLGGDAIEVDIRATPGEPADDPFAIPTPPAPTGDAGFGGGSAGGAGGGGGSLFSPPQVTSPPGMSSPAADLAPVDDAPSTEVAGRSEETAASAPAARTRPVSRAGELAGNLHPASFLLVPLALGVLLAMSHWLGPAGQPSTIDRRGGVSRALAGRDRIA
jgi:hypothetical protein